MADAFALPSYREQTPEVAERFQRLKARPVLLDVRNLGKTFDSGSGSCLALDRISFRAHRREFLCVIGPSGCGKSTLARIIAGLDAPTAGEMLLDGKPIDGPGPDRGMVFQSYTLFPWLTVKRNIMFGPEVSRGLVERRRRKAKPKNGLTWLDWHGLRIPTPINCRAA